MAEPLDRSRRDSTLFQFTTKQLRDFIDPNHLLIRIDEQLDFAKLVEPFTYYLGCSGRPLGANRTGDTGVGPTQIEGAQPGRPAEDAGRDYLSAAQRLPVEPAAQGVGRRQHHPSDLPTLGRCGALEGIWAVLIEECQELGGVNWEWQSADCSMGKARFGGRHWTKPHRPGQSRQQEEPPGRRSRRTPERCGGWSQRP